MLPFALRSVSVLPVILADVFDVGMPIVTSARHAYNVDSLWNLSLASVSTRLAQNVVNAMEFFLGSVLLVPTKMLMFWPSVEIAIRVMSMLMAIAPCKKLPVLQAASVLKTRLVKNALILTETWQITALHALACIIQIVKESVLLFILFALQDADALAPHHQSVTRVWTTEEALIRGARRVIEGSS